MTALVPAVGAAMVIAGLIGVVAGLVPHPVPAARPVRVRRPQVRVSRRTMWLLLAGLLVGIVAALLTGWLVAVVLVPVAAAGLPVLMSASDSRHRIQRLEAVEEWVRSLSGVLTAGVGLEQALVATLRSAPEPIRPEVARLVARLRARWSTEAALRALADELDDATGDLITATLILGARRRGAGLASVLESLAESVAADVRARRQIEADRAKPRTTARWVTIITVAVLVALGLTGEYVAPYGSGVGQIVLAVLLACYAGVLVWMRRMAAGRPLPRFIGDQAAKRGHPMITGLQLALLGGLMVMAGLTLLVAWLVPARPDLADALARLNPDVMRPGPDLDAAGTSTVERLGRWAMRRLPATMWGAAPVQQLALLRISRVRFYGEKLLFGALGLVAAPLLSVLLAVLGWRLPVVLPVVGSLGLAVGMFFLPNYNVRDDAKRARSEFARSLGAYADLVALERNAGSGPRQALEVAAAVGDGWVFRRIREELAFSSWSGEQPWQALRRLSRELGVPELGDLADIVRLSGEEGAQIYRQLRARSSALRAAMLTDEVGHANEVGEKLSIPMSILGVIFLMILVAPALLRVMGG